MTEIQLSDEDRAFIEAKLRSGVYKSAEDVVRAGLRLLKRQENEAEELRRLVGQGLEDLEAGRLHEYATASDLLQDVRQRAADDAPAKRLNAKGRSY
ncbi:type II toxin-antitoxin system ParD family antitoxin [Rhizobium sp. SGZ-381]|uniref:type II toxin-antitoxin system ParD family antitoxin n=1 Tax=Rhizobium sp. SGZ-381 TaxID=3342800 RepID=UPI00367181FA